MSFINTLLAPSTYDIVYMITASLSLVGIFFALVYLTVRTNKIKKHFNIDKGMTYEQIIEALGGPLEKEQKGATLKCKWNLTIDGKVYKINTIFKNGVLTTLI